MRIKENKVMPDPDDIFHANIKIYAISKMWSRHLI